MKVGAAHLRHSRRQRRPRPQRRHRRRLPRHAGDRSGTRPAQWRGRAARSREGEQEHRALHGVDALPRRAHDRHRGVSGTAKYVNSTVQEAEFGTVRRAADQDVLRPVGHDRRVAEGRDASARPTSPSTASYIAGPRRRARPLPRRRPDPHRRRHRVLRGRRQRAVLRRRGDEQLVPGRDRGDRACARGWPRSIPSRPCGRRPSSRHTARSATAR